MPIMKNCVAKARDGESIRPSGAASAPMTPMMKEPVTLMARVPHGNVSPKRVDEMNPLSQKRPTLPSAPPIATQKYAIIIKSYHRGRDREFAESSSADSNRRPR